ncbi:PAS domain-containing protein [Variovorax ginsengisoli]|uniref:histidine kinase n=1 Tax=Variovorax ginsengisoli TaxID=363844 RepID=A0ABT9S4E1_9BURK|nr:PAS domain-containing protein [Variovorax ginsengisoli]MDP9898237.1 PAS domain S-box-containing protein [Variovorax ginsengisoli]
MVDLPFNEFNDPVWAILDVLPTMLSYWDSELQCRFANRAYEQWFGVKASHLFGSSLRDLLGPENFARTEPYIRGVLSGVPQEFDRMMSDPQHPGRAGLVNYLPHIVNGKVLGFVVQVTDVSRLHDIQAQLRVQVEETEQARQLLQKSEANLRQAQGVGRIGSWEYDVENDVTTWSHQLYAIYGLPPDQPPPGFPAHASLYTPESWLRLVVVVDRAIRLGEPYALELEFIDSRGRRGWLDARGRADRDRSGRIVSLHGTAQEISVNRHLAGAERAVMAADPAHDRVAALAQALDQARARIAELEAQLAARSPPHWTPEPPAA